VESRDSLNDLLAVDDVARARLIHRNRRAVTVQVVLLFVDHRQPEAQAMGRRTFIRELEEEWERLPTDARKIE
jgi:hypothetical protein